MNQTRSNSHTKSELYTIVLVCMLWGSRLMSLITSASLRVLGGSQLAYFVVPSIEIVFVFLGWRYISRKIKSGDILFFLMCILAFLSSYVFFPANEIYLDEYLGGYITCCTMLFFGLLLNVEKMEKPMYIISILTILFQFYFSLFYYQNKVGTFEEAGEEYNGMYYAYVTLPHVLFAFHYMLKNYSISKLLVSLAGLFLLLAYGSRGPVLCVFAYLALYFVLIGRFKHKWFYFFALIIFFVLIYLYLNVILAGLQFYIGNLGMRTKIVDMMQEGSITDDSGRSELLSMLWMQLNFKGVLGLGFCGSFPIIGIYPHNLLYDFWVTFGLFFGSILFIALIILLIHGYSSCYTKSEKSIWILFLATGFIHLFLSDTFINTSSFFVMIGYSILMIRNKKKNQALHISTANDKDYVQQYSI